MVNKIARNLTDLELARLLNEKEDQKNIEREIKKILGKTTESDQEDVYYNSVYGLANLVNKKKARVFSEQLKFTGYYQQHGDKIFWMKPINSERLTMMVKGHEHRVLSFDLNSYEKRKFALETMKALGYKSKKQKRGGDWFYVGKK